MLSYLFSFHVIYILSISSVLPADDGVFVVSEDEFFNPEDYDRNSALSSEESNYSEQVKIEDEFTKPNPEKLTGSINLDEF